MGWNKCAHLLFLSIDDIYLIRMTKNISFSIWFQRRKWLSLQNENLNALDFEGQFVHLLGIKCKFVGGPNSESRFSSFWPKRSSYTFFKTLLMECNVKQPPIWFLGPVLLYTHFQTNKRYLAHNRNNEFERQGYTVSPWKNTANICTLKHSTFSAF